MPRSTQLSIKLLLDYKAISGKEAMLELITYYSLYGIYTILLLVLALIVDVFAFDGKHADTIALLGLAIGFTTIILGIVCVAPS